MISRGASERHGSLAASVDGSTRILAIDYGRKRIGLAVSDAIKLTARPLAVLTRSNRRNDLRRLREVCQEQSVSLIVVGQPLNMSGSAGEMAEEAARFANRLAKELGLPTELFDERLTTWQAENQANSTRRKGEPVDDLAAAFLLRDYLEKNPPRGRDTAQKA